MTDRAALLMDLAERCEQASGPDRELDARIYILTTGGSAADADYAATDPDVTCKPLRYTASLDAALTLVPEGWAWAVYGGAREEIVATAYCVPNGGRLPWPDWVTDICAATPALALCAAALRALASGAPR